MHAINKHVKLISCFCVALPLLMSSPLQANAADKQHWVQPTLESLQNQNLYLNLKPSIKDFNQTITIKQFQSIFSELWLSETVTLPSTYEFLDQNAMITRQEAADRIFDAFKPYLNDKETDAIKWIKATSIMKGYPDGSFHPEEKVTLAQGVATMNNIKNYLKLQPELSARIGRSDSAATDTLSYSVKANADGKIDFILAWGEKKTGGYSITITETKVEGNVLQVYYKTKSPGPDDMVTQALTYPKSTYKLDMTLEAYQQLKVTLIEVTK